MSQNSPNLPYLSIIMPAYNDAEAVQIFLPKVFAFTESLCAPANGDTLTDKTVANRCEIIIVDDGSQDNLAQVVATLMPTRPNNTAIHLIRLSRNFGKEPALSAGLAKAQGDVVAMIDADTNIRYLYSRKCSI